MELQGMEWWGGGAAEKEEERGSRGWILVRKLYLGPLFFNTFIPTSVLYDTAVYMLKVFFLDSDGIWTYDQRP